MNSLSSYAPPPLPSNSGRWFLDAAIRDVARRSIVWSVGWFVGQSIGWSVGPSVSNPFLDASSHLYNSLCLSVGWLVGLSVTSSKNNRNTKN